jgi:hypothetical protein
MAGAALLMIYPLQVARIAFRKGAQRRFSWWYSSLMIATKFAEAWGAVRFFAAGGPKRIASDYKR